MANISHTLPEGAPIPCAELFLKRSFWQRLGGGGGRGAALHEQLQSYVRSVLPAAAAAHLASDLAIAPHFAAGQPLTLMWPAVAEATLLGTDE